MNIAQRIKAPGPKKILALDGGGIRGMMTVEVLGQIEALLRSKLGKGPEFVLADYFDFVAGTSTGAIIAACISLGMSVQAIREFYVNCGAEMFDKASFLRRFRYKYEDEKLAGKMQNIFGKSTTSLDCPGCASSPDATGRAPFVAEDCEVALQRIRPRQKPIINVS